MLRTGQAVLGQRHPSCQLHAADRFECAAVLTQWNEIACMLTEKQAAQKMN